MPAVFWSLSLPEWRVMLMGAGPSAAATLSRTEFDRLLLSFPDEHYV